MSKADLIDRQEAIDAIQRYKYEHGFDFHACAMGIERDIKALPSAQPEIIRCKECGKREVCRTSTVWAVPPKDNWYCADAEKRRA